MYERKKTYIQRFSVTIAKGNHLYPSRTQKLSLSAPMVLSWTRLGRVGRRRIFHSSIAQSVEHAAVNRRVVGSSPTGGAISVVRKGYRQLKPQDTESFLWFFAIYCAFRAICPFSIFFDFNGCFFADFHKNRSRTYDVIFYNLFR